LPSAFTLLWQLEQRPATAGVAVAWLNVPVAHVVVELWQVSHCAVVAMCVVGLVCAFCATYVPPWQLAQLPADTGPVVLAWFIVAGAKLANPLTWHVSHCAPVGMWFVTLPSAVLPL
jgi:hypothetical protein